MDIKFEISNDNVSYTPTTAISSYSCMGFDLGYAYSAINSVNCDFPISTPLLIVALHGIPEV